MLRIMLAVVHLLGLGIGLGAVLTRGSVLRGKVDATMLRLAMRYDVLWGVAAFLWISTGLWRLLGQTEKALSFYMTNHFFLTKMALLLLILVLEIKPIVVIGRWRKQLRGGAGPDEIVKPEDARAIARISHIQALIVVVMVSLAVSFARGLG